MLLTPPQSLLVTVNVLKPMDFGESAVLSARASYKHVFFKCTESYQIWTLGLMQFYVYPVLIRLFKSVCVRFPHSKSCLWASIVLRDYD